MRQQRIALSNQKGGVGKSTCTRELGMFLADAGSTVLVTDIDPQANITRSLTDGIYPGLYEGLTGEAYEVPEVAKNLFLLSGSIKLAALEKSLIGEIDAYTRLAEFFTDGLFERFEYILMDTPPSMGVLTINALSAARHVLIPMSPSLYSMQGTNDLMATMRKVKKSFNAELHLLGVIVNAFDGIPVITRQIKAEIDGAFGELVFKTALSKSIRIEEAIATKTGLISLPKGKVKDEIESIGLEFIERLERFEKEQREEPFSEESREGESMKREDESSRLQELHS